MSHRAVPGSSRLRGGASVFLAAVAVLFWMGRPHPCGAVIAAAGVAKDSVAHAADDLGSESRNDSLDFEIFYRHPARAAGELVSRLQPIKRGRYSKHPAVVWYLRALRSLTGFDLRARTTRVLSDDEKHYLADDHYEDNGVRFFATWMSRDLVYVAPADAQRAIIDQWRSWYAREGQKFEYQPSRDIHDWYD